MTTARESRERIAATYEEPFKREVAPMSDAFKRQLDRHYRENFRNLVNRYAGAAKNRHDGEDIVQSAYLKACEYWDTILDLDAWIATRLRNEFKDYLRDRITKGAVSISLDDVNPTELSYDPLGEDFDTIKEALDKLSAEPEQRKQILTLFFFDQFASHEIAGQLGITPAAVRKTVERFRQTL